MLDIVSRIGLILTALRGAIGSFASAQGRAPGVVWVGTQAFVEITRPSPLRPLPRETWDLLAHRLARVAQRFQSLFARWQSGTLAPSARPSPHLTPRPRPTHARPYPRLPRSRGWINARIPAAAPCAGRLNYLLQQPDMPAFLTAIPQAARLLRPLCHALALDTPLCLRLPPRPRKPRPRKPKSSAPSASNAYGATTPTPDRPIPAYVLAAARAWRKKSR